MDRNLIETCMDLAWSEPGISLLLTDENELVSARRDTKNDVRVTILDLDDGEIYEKVIR
jgi:hypothetical protein